MRVWMALDPETSRVLMQDHDFSESDFPRGLRGLSWPCRVGEVPDDAFKAMTTGGLPAAELDELHRSAWTAAGPTPWPEP